MSIEKEFNELFARLDDLKKRAVRGELGISAFFSPRELHYAQEYLTRTGTPFLSFGGYGAAERKRMYLLPEYMETLEDTVGFSEFGYDDCITVVRVHGSGFETLTHRAFMGSLLSLGLERDVIGDILLDGDGALVFCDERIAEFLLENWQKVGKDKVKLEITELQSDFLPHRSYLPLSDTIASPRLDCVVAALCKLSREKAKDTVEAGCVELDYETQSRVDREVREQSILSVRGFGKFRILSLCDKTRKGRYKLSAEKYL